MNRFLKGPLDSSEDIEEGMYVITCVTQDMMRMLLNTLKRQLPEKEARMSAQVALESVLLDYGLEVKVRP